jgi:hypothetical protein
MCRPASFVVTKDRVYWSKASDSHEDIIRENDLKESNIRSEIQFVRVEICPPDEDFRKPLDQWQFHTDQDLLPDWYVESEEEKRVRAVLPDWLRAKVILPEQSVDKVNGSVLAIYGTVESIDDGTVKYIHGGTVRSIRGGTVEYIRGGTVRSIDGGTVRSIDGGTVESIRSGTVEYIRGGTVKYIHGGTVEYIHGGTVKSIRGGTVEYIHDGTVESIHGGTVEYIHDGTVKYIDGGTVKYIHGGTVRSIRGGTVEYIRGGTVEYIRGQFPSRVNGNPTIINYGSLTPDILKSSKAVMIDRSKEPVVCYVGKDI